VAWSIAEYLGSLERAVGELMTEQDTPEVTAEPEPEDPTPETTSP
jgi:hypothetical protein